MGQRPIGGGGSNPCSTPEIVASYACGGVVTLSASPTTASAYYDWNLGNGSTATGPGPITAIYTGAGPYTVTLTLTATSGNAACSVSTTETVLPTQGGGCCPSGIAASNLLGAVGRTTTISGGGTYSGAYRVLGSLVLTNGSYILTNATFYVDGAATKRPLAGGGFQRTVSGGTITLGANATLTLDNSTLTASGSGPACAMWRGLVLNNSGQGTTTGSYRLVMQNNSTISHALCGLTVADSYQVSQAGDTEYSIDHSAFAHNLTHINDRTTHIGPRLSVIASSTFESDPAQMHLPYDQTSATDLFYTYQALLLTPLDNNQNRNYVLDVHDNTIRQAVYGIVDNVYDRAGVLIHDNRLQGIYHTGIWTVDKIAQPSLATISVISGNQVFLDTAPGLQTEQIDAMGDLYGFFSEAPLHSYSHSFEQNYVRSYLTDPKRPVGMALFGAIDVKGNYLADVTDAIRTTAQDGVLFDNYINECLKGIVVQDGGSYSYQTTTGCNTFIQGSYPLQYGIEVQPNAYLGTQGSRSSAAGNNFDSNIPEAIHNDGLPFTYWYASSLQEASILTTTAPTSYVTFRPATPPATGWTNYCNSQGATKGNGVNQRGAVLSAATVATLADSIRLRQVAPARRRAYLYEVLNYYQNRNQLAALETWWATLLPANVEDYRTVGLTLLRTYDAQPAPAAAQRVLALLQPQALLNAEVSAALQYRLVRQHLPQTTPRLARADSTVLRALAGSGTSLAERAAQWLHYFYPRLRLPAAPAARAAQVASRPARPQAIFTGAMLGEAYPNPTQAAVRIPYQLPPAATSAELRFVDLLTGQLRLTVPLKVGSSSEAQTVQVPHLPAGQYVCRLLVNGQPVAVPQRLVILP